jgi:hypothetical protein
LEPPNNEPQSGPGPDFGSSQDAPSESAFVRFGLLFYGVLAAAGVIWRVGFYREPIFLLDPSGVPSDIAWVRDVGLGVATAALLIGGSDWMTKRTAWGDELARVMARALGPMSVPNAVLLAFASGFAEELFFRGALQPRAGLVLASLLFGCVHFVPQRAFLPWTGFAVVAGLLFGVLFEWTGNLIAPIVAHTLVNAVNLPLLVRRYGPGAAAGDENEPEEPGGPF